MQLVDKTRYDKLREQGLLGVASSPEVLMANIERIVERFDEHFVPDNLNYVLKHPGKFAGWRYTFSHLPEEGKETIKISLEGKEKEALIRRAKRNLAYKVLRRKANYGAELKFWLAYPLGERQFQIEMSCIPVCLEIPF